MRRRWPNPAFAQRRQQAALIRRIYGADPLVCPRCRVPMRIIAFITEPRVIHKILRHLAAKVPDSRGPSLAQDGDAQAA